VRAVLAGTCGDQQHEASEAGSDPGVSLIHDEVEQLQWRLGDYIEGPAVMLLPQVPGSKEDRRVEGPPKLTGQPYPCQLPPVAEHGIVVWRQGLPADGMKEPVPNFPREHARTQEVIRRFVIMSAQCARRILL